MSTHSKLQASPLTFRPVLKTVMWGGSRLSAYKNLPDAPSNLGESWEISAVPEMETVVESGIYQDTPLSSLARDFGAELLGSSVVSRYGNVFPLLIKFIDAAKDLSVQVHPDDTMAFQRHGCLGKAEMWYIIDADPEALIYSGFNTPLDSESYLRHLHDDTLEDTLSSYRSRAGQVYFLPPGRIHAIGAGNLVAEITENSDVTYRIYDYGRLDSDGNPRTLHTDLALGAIDFTHPVNVPFETEPIPPEGQMLVDCRQFVTHLLQAAPTPLRLDHDSRSFTIVICISGKVILTYPGGSLTLTAGHTALLPALLDDVSIIGDGKVLTTRSRR
ncbi:MAG: mannose-6-phosphate isomerase [Bacteroides sp.]|nr:mannose-6-phosphate isomerase [Bacteroides sp.]